MSVLPCAVLLATCVLLFSAIPARADAGVPMLAIVWPSSWLLLLAIVPIEAAVAVRLLNTGWKKSLTMVGVANLASTIVGIPATWVLLVVCQMLLGGGGAFGLQSNLTRVIAVTLQSPWLIPYQNDLPWMVPAAAAVLCVPFFFMSVVVEYFCARRFVSTDSRPLVWRWSWIANGLTYGCIVIGLLALLVYVLQGHFNEKFGYVDPSGRLMPQPATTLKNGAFADGLAPVLVGRKWGYIDRTGKCVIAPQFDEAEQFSESTAQVTINQQRAFIDKDGHLVVKPCSIEETKPFSESVACVCIGKKWGFVDRTGKLVIRPQYEDAERFSEGLARVKIGEKWAYISHDGQIKIKPQYKYAKEFSEGLASVEQADDRWQYIDNSGRVIITMPERTRGEKFSEGLAVFKPDFGQLGYIDKTGQTRIKPTLDRAEQFSEGLACVCVGAKRQQFGNGESVDFTSSKYGYIDKTGRFVIEPRFESADSFADGRAAVRIGRRWGFIDKHGNIAIEPKFSRVGTFSDGLAAVGERWAIDVP